MRRMVAAAMACALVMPLPGAAQVFGPAALPVTPAATPATTGDVAADFIAPPPPGAGQVVFYRPGGYVGSAISCAVRENDTLLTHLPPGRFGVVNVAAGIHIFAVSSEATDVMRVDVRPGQTHYGMCAVAIGLFAGRPQLTPVAREAFFAIAPQLKPVRGTILASSPLPAPPQAAMVSAPPVAAPAALAVAARDSPRRPSVDDGIPLNSAYTAPPPEIFIKTLPPRP